MQHVPAIQPKRVGRVRHLCAMSLRMARHAERPGVALVTFGDVIHHDTFLVATGAGLIAILAVEVVADIVTVLVRKEDQ